MCSEFLFFKGISMRMKRLVVIAALVFTLVSVVSGFAAEDVKPDVALAKDMELLQGGWEMRHGNEGKGEPTIRSTKLILGNRETLRRYSIASGELLSEKTVEFKLSRSGPVRVFTFYPVGGDAESGLSFVYKVDENEFYDTTGLLHGTEYRDYSSVPTTWRWTRASKTTSDKSAVAGDMELLQGSWQLLHGNEGKGSPTIRSVKTITGNVETLRRYSIESGKMLSEKIVEFKLNESGPVRVLSFFRVGEEAKPVGSYVYKVEKNEFYDITGLLHGAEYRDYSSVPTMWRWTRVTEKATTIPRSTEQEQVGDHLNDPPSKPVYSVPIP